jgi:hypothetical protein
MCAVLMRAADLRCQPHPTMRLTSLIKTCIVELWKQKERKGAGEREGNAKPDRETTCILVSELKIRERGE